MKITRYILVILIFSFASCKTKKYYYTESGGIRPNSKRFFPLSKDPFTLHDTLLIDTNSIYVREIGTMFFPRDEKNDDTLTNAHVYFRFYASGRLTSAITDSFPSADDVNNTKRCAVGYYKIHKNKICIEFISITGDLTKKNGKTVMNEMYLYDPGVQKLNKAEIFKKIKFNSLVFTQPDW